MHVGKSVFFHLAKELPNLPAVVYMCAMVGEAVSNTSIAFGSKAPMSWSYVLLVYPHLTDGMLVRQWCPSTNNILDMVTITMYASMPIFQPARTLHGHGKCTVKFCVANSVDPSTDAYVTKHVTETCQCQFQIPVLVEVVDKILDNRIPVVKLNCNGHLIVQDASQVTVDYVAISHVWSDGLGSTTESGLPTCQIQRLANITRRLVPGGAFWMDSLCIPSQQAARKRAIGIMGKIYRTAAKVLVIDSSIRILAADAPTEEKLFRIATSGWMSRLWTLQEGMLAKELVFELSSGTACAYQHLMPSTDELYVNTVIAPLAAALFRLTKGDQFDLVDIARALVVRRTSRAPDETLAIACLLGVDAEELAGLEPQERMKTLLLRIGKLPRSILTLGGPRMAEPGFRWAPRTLMTAHSARLTWLGDHVLCTPEGLLGTYSCLVFHQTTFGQGLMSWRLTGVIRGPTGGSEEFYDLLDCSDGESEPFVCNMLLITQHLRLGESLPCAAVLGIPCEGASEDRVNCVFKKNLLISRVSESSSQSKSTPHMGKATLGRVRVCVT
ncbi:hypothetical protein EV426DRAFT_678427 [Tirmania nivea]|nr:hypothetical protein EV426DRAFT_678427 [Tirmania nivea]